GESPTTISDSATFRIRWMFDVGCWMLGVGCWVLDVGCWMLGVGCWVLDVGCWMLGVGCWMFDVGCSMLDVRCSEFEVFPSSPSERSYSLPSCWMKKPGGRMRCCGSLRAWPSARFFSARSPRTPFI